MKLELSYSVENILILGAGASVDFGLPTWNDLSSLIVDKIKNDSLDRYKYKKEILDWVGKIDQAAGYKTIDECIANESKGSAYHSNGDYVEDEVFLVIKDIFDETYNGYENSWIMLLNSKILNSRSMERTIAFINYNYDKVLEENFLNFKYLSGKQQRLNSRDRLEELSEVVVPALYPHGSVYLPSELKSDSKISRYIKTMKSGVGGYIDAVSCYESSKHSIGKANVVSGLKLFILGLGGGLKINLSNIDINNTIKEVHVTIKDPKIKDEIIGFLSEKYSVPVENINVYGTCKELVEKCF